MNRSPLRVEAGPERRSALSEAGNDRDEDVPYGRATVTGRAIPPKVGIQQLCLPGPPATMM